MAPLARKATSNGPKGLRADAEAKLARDPPRAGSHRASSALLHELQVHQVELEMQNEELRRAQLALEQARDRYLDLYDFAPVGYLTLSDAGRIREANLTAAGLLNVDRKGLIGLPFVRFVGMDADGWLQFFSRLVRSGEPRSCDLVIHRSDASAFDGHLACQRRVTEDEASVRVVLTDVTLLKRAEAQRLDALQAAIEGLPIGVAAAEQAPDGVVRLTHWNPAFEEILGAPVAPDAPHPTDVPVAFRPDRTTPIPFAEWPGSQAIRTGKVVRDVEMHVRQPRGEWRIVMASAAPLEPRAGARRRSVAVMLDISTRLRAEADLRVSEQRFRDVVASADEYVFEMDARGTVTFLSDAVEKVLGYRPEDLLGQSSIDYLGPVEKARSAAFLRERASRKESFSHFQQEATHRSGSPVWLDVSAVPVLAADGTIQGFRGAALDITQRHLAELERASLQAQLAQAHKLESIGRLAGGVAHDFNNLLTVILSYGVDMQMDFRMGAVPDARHVDEIVAAGRRAADLTRQLLAFARKQAITPVAVDVNDCIRSSHKLLRRLIPEDIRVVETLEPGLWPVRCDPGLVDQVIMNLAVNARDAMAGGGTLTLATENVNLGSGDAVPDLEMDPGCYVKITVKDTGTGMPPEVLDHIFEPFFTTKAPGAGTGLGLPTVYGLVKQNDGHVSARSAPGAGSVFEIFLPRSPPGAQELDEAFLAAPRGSETVLVVEDDADVLAAAARGLRSAGYAVFTANGPEQALEIARNERGPLHLVLADVVMPGLGGYPVGQRIAELMPGVRIVYMSGYTQDILDRQGILGDGVAFIPKPFSTPELLARVREVLDGSPSARISDVARPPRPG